METIGHLIGLQPAPAEILIIDQSREHEAETNDRLSALQNEGRIRWIRLPAPSIPHAMNAGLSAAAHDIVLFLDDDIVPDQDLVAAHARAQREGCAIVAGQVLQPGEGPLPHGEQSPRFRFCSSERRFVSELMGGNFSIQRRLALELGGFDENFVEVAYRFEAEFSERALGAGNRILFEPAASIRHLKAAEGGTRSYGNYLKSIRPGHSVGEYYYLLRSRNTSKRLMKMLKRPLRAVATKHHLRQPWWIPVTLIAEALGFGWAVLLYFRGPRLISEQK
jgi:GT2 family glycosyltransferase